MYENGNKTFQFQWKWEPKEENQRQQEQLAVLHSIKVKKFCSSRKKISPRIPISMSSRGATSVHHFPFVANSSISVGHRRHRWNVWRIYAETYSTHTAREYQKAFITVPWSKVSTPRRLHSWWMGRTRVAKGGSQQSVATAANIHKIKFWWQLFQFTNWLPVQILIDGPGLRGWDGWMVGSVANVWWPVAVLRNLLPVTVSISSICGTITVNDGRFGRTGRKMKLSGNWSELWDEFRSNCDKKGCHPEYCASNFIANWISICWWILNRKYNQYR